jgi:hypothetical protein
VLALIWSRRVALGELFVKQQKLVLLEDGRESGFVLVGDAMPWGSITAFGS